MKNQTSQFKLSPCCDVMIEKDGGSDVMECKLCKEFWCWTCLKIFPYDTIYKHLDLHSEQI